MTNVIPFKQHHPCIECDECGGIQFYFTDGGKIACPDCEVFLDGVKWEYVDE